jgi:hypothetical protein
VVTLNKHQFEGILYHGTNNADEILASGEVIPSSDNSVAGASGIYTSTKPFGAREWGEDVVSLQTRRPLNLHPDIETDPHLSQMRRQRQFANDFHNMDEEELHDFYGEGYDDKFPLTKESVESSQDVSSYLAKKGYHGHYDSLASSPRQKHIVVYSPEDLIPIKRERRR